MAISVPDSHIDTSLIVDCMELSSFLSDQKTFRLDDIENAFEISQDEEEEDIGASDALAEDIRSRVGAEVDRRQQALQLAYPFAMSPNGEELSFTSEDNLGRVAYLLSLLIQNSWADGLLSVPHKITENEFISARSSFEVLAAVAAAGYARGPSFHIGRNRGGSHNLMAHLRTAWITIQDGSIRASPIDDAPRHANDDGIDAISFRPSQSGVPHQSIVYVQSAAGQDWKTKSIKTIVDRFLRNWFEVPPVSPQEYLMVVAALPDRRVVFQETQVLGFISHRLETPLYVLRAHELQLAGAIQLDCSDDLNVPTDWMTSYLSARNLIP
jgi:hypothetical protein